MSDEIEKMKPICSVVIPMYNAERTIADTLYSVQMQNIKNIEIICVDDRSTDSTCSIVEEMIKNDSRIVLLRNEKNLRVSETRNRGIRYAHSDYIALLDSDDMWKEGYLEAVLKARDEGGAQFICTSCEFIDNDGKPLDCVFTIPERITYKTLLKQNKITCSSVFIKKDLLLSHPFYADEVHEDYLCWLSILKEGIKVIGIKEPLVIYRLTKGSKSRNKFKAIKMSYKTYRKHGLPFFKSLHYTFLNAINGLKKYSRIKKKKNEFSFLNKLKFVKFRDILSFFPLLVMLIPALICKIFIRDFWLVCEDKFEARDNGYWFFKYVRTHHKEQKIAYAINKKTTDYEKVKDLGKVINFGSLSHWFWYIVADKNISSQKNGKPNAAVCYFFEVKLKFRKHNRVFLQHGVTINNVKFIHYKNSRFDKIITATMPETEYMKENFGYPPHSVKLAGFCRFDNLDDTLLDKNIILVMPTWRQWISKGVELQKVEGTDDFTKTCYYKHWQSFINNKDLDELLKKENKTLIFYPHRNMQKYLVDFKCDSKNIIIANSKNYDVQDLLKTAGLLITDYSSVFFDFAYMKKPIIFYQFDEEMMRKYQLEKGYFSYKSNGFSTWVDSENDAIEKLKYYIKNSLELDDKNAVDSYFKYTDKNNCERNYNVVKYGKVTKD